MTSLPKHRGLFRPAEAASDDFLDETLRVWQPHSKKPLNREDAREIVENISGFFRVLRDWAEEDRRAGVKDRTKASLPGHEPR